MKSTMAIIIQLTAASKNFGGVVSIPEIGGRGKG
jgi:hypothetical protein